MGTRRRGCKSRLKNPRSPRQWPQAFVPALVLCILPLHTTECAEATEAGVSGASGLALVPPPLPARVLKPET